MIGELVTDLVVDLPVVIKELVTDPEVLREVVNPPEVIDIKDVVTGDVASL